MSSKSELKRMCVMNPLEMAERIAELERRNAHLADALNRIVTEDVGTAKCVSIAYKALSATPEERIKEGRI